MLCYLGLPEPQGAEAAGLVYYTMQILWIRNLSEMFLKIFCF